MHPDSPPTGPEPTAIQESAASGLCLGCFSVPEQPGSCTSCGFDLARCMQGGDGALAPGTLLRERYVVGRVLGRGGFGITYLGWDLRLQRRRAIKEYFPNGVAQRIGNRADVQPTHGFAALYASGIDKYLEEARLLAQFEHHPCIVSPRDFFASFGTAYLVMEFLEGETLASYVQHQGGRIPYAHALFYLRPVLEALATVHRAGILHRDVSPDNVYVTTEGSSKLLDFGAARQRIVGQSAALTVILREHFAPPEQYSATGKQGSWTDVYAAAATFYFAITGQAPPAAPERFLNDRLKRPSELGVEIPPDAEAALLAALSLRAEQRPRDVRLLLDALDQEANAPKKPAPERTLRARPGTLLASLGSRLDPRDLPLRLGLPPARSWLVAVCGLGAVAVLAVLVAVGSWPEAEPRTPPTTAESAGGSAGAAVAGAPAVAPAPTSEPNLEAAGSAGGVGTVQPPEPPGLIRELAAVGSAASTGATQHTDASQDTANIEAAAVPAGPAETDPGETGGAEAGPASGAAGASPSVLLTVRSPHVGDRLFIDGELVGATGATEHALRAGAHVIRVEKDEYLPYEASIELAAGSDPRVLYVELEPDPTVLEARFREVTRKLDAEPAGADPKALASLFDLAARGHTTSLLEALHRSVYSGDAAAVAQAPAALDAVRHAAARRNPEASYLLGLYLEYGAWPQRFEELERSPSPLESRKGILTGIMGMFTKPEDIFRESLTGHTTPGSPDQLREAAKLYLSAANAGHAGAQERLGYMNAAGRGVERNSRAAFYWFLRAAQAGSSEAQYTLGMSYLIGEGYAANADAAACWLARAAAGGQQAARTQLARLGTPLAKQPPEQNAKLSCDFPPAGPRTSPGGPSS